MTRNQVESTLEHKRQVLRELIVKKDSSRSADEYEFYLVNIWQVQLEIKKLKELNQEFGFKSSYISHQEIQQYGDKSFVG